MKKIIKFIKRNVFSCTCFLLAIAVCLTGTFSYARYISVDSYDRSPGAGSFSCSANIDGVSALSFTNTAFWGGTTSEDKIAMNALRAIEFKVNNFEGTGSDKKVSEVKMNYQLIFSAPKNFIEKLAIQLFDDTSTAILPQIVLQDLVKSSGTYNTASSEDFNGSPATDLTFTVTKSGNDFTATAGDIKIEIDEVNIEIEQALQYRVWDVSALTNEINTTATTEGGKLLPPLEVKFTSEVTCYRIKISMPQFKFDAGTEQTRNYSLRLVPTATLEDDHLGGYLMDGTEKPTTIYAGQTLGVQTVKEAISDYTDEACTSLIPGSEQIVNVHGEPKKYADETTDIQTYTTIEYGEPGETGSYQVSEEYGEVTVGSAPSINGNSSWNNINANGDVVGNTTNVTHRVSKLGTYTQTGTRVKTIVMGEDAETKAKEIMTEKDVITTTTPISNDGTNIRVEIKTTTITTVLTSRTIDCIPKVYTQTEQLKRTGYFRQDRVGNNWGATYWHNDDNGGSDGWTVTSTGTRTLQETQSRQEKIAKSITESSPDIITIYRKIVRTSEKHNVKLTSVKRQVQEGDTLVTKSYDESNKFDLFEGEIQKFFVSQSYSKNYPLKVNVIFEQTQ